MFQKSHADIKIKGRCKTIDGLIDKFLTNA